MTAFSWVLLLFPLYLMINGRLAEYISMVRPDNGGQ